MRDHEGLSFPVSEYERRLGELRKRMAARNLDVVLITDPGNLFYLTGHQTSGYSYFQCLIVPLSDKPAMVTRKLEESNVVHRTWVEITRPYSDTGDAIQTTFNALKEFKLHEAVVGYERNSYFFPAYQQDRMHDAFTRGNLVDCFGIVEETRICKSELELDFMRKAAHAAEQGMLAGYDAAAPGVSENVVAAEICRAMFAAGGEFPAVLPYVTSGPRSMIGHATWEGRVAQPGEHFFLEVGGCYRRYHAAIMRTVLLGEMTPSMAQAEERILTALTALEDFIRPGVTVSDVDRVAREILTDNTVDAILITRVGYSIGIAFPPSWDEGYMLSLKPGDATVLKAGMTLHLIPWLWGIDRTKTAGISDTIVVTEDGCESLFQLDRGFVVKPEA